MRHSTWVSILCAAIVALPAAAAAGPWHAGVRTGLSLANLHGDLPDLAKPDYRAGFQGGGFVELAPGPVGIQLEALYVQKGAVFESDITDQSGNILGSFKDRLQLSYLEIPVLVRASLPLSGAVSPYAVIGPTFGIALAAKYDSGYSSALDVDFSDDLQSPDIGGAVGVGARIGRGLHHALVEVRYTTGFSDLWDIPANLESINHGFALSIGYEH